MENKNYAIVTFLFNNYDLLREPLVVDENIDYYCITDDKELTSNVWNCIYVKEFDTDKLNGIQKTYMSKYSFYKYLPQKYKYYINIDASIEVADKLSPIMNFIELGDYDICLSMHPERDNWNDEYKKWVADRGLDEKYVEKFNEFATSMGFDPNGRNGLIECTVKIYKNNETVIKFIDDIYNTIKETNNFEDKNEQCYLTCVYSKYVDKLKPLYFTRNLYSNSKYFNSYYHKSNQKWVNHVSLKDNTNTLFGKKVELIGFPIKENENLDIFIGTHKTFDPEVTNETYKIIVGNHDIENHSNLKLINCKHDFPLDDRFFSEIYMFDYIVKNVPLKKYIGFCHYRKYFSFMDDIPDMDELFNEYDCIVGKPLQLNITTRKHYATFHNIEDLEIVENIIKEKYNDYYDLLESFLDNNLLIPYNMFIMKQEDFKEYCDFVFGVMNEYLNIVGTDIYKRINENKEKYLKDFSPNDTVEYQYRIGGYIIERLTNVFMIKHFKKLKWYKVIVTEQKYNKRDS